jgi:hypothetical protein
MLQLPDWPLRIGEAMRALLIFLLMLSLTAPVAAGQLEVGMAAHDRGDYESAFRLWQPLEHFPITHGHIQLQRSSFGIRRV